MVLTWESLEGDGDALARRSRFATQTSLLDREVFRACRRLRGGLRGGFRLPLLHRRVGFAFRCRLGRVRGREREDGSGGEDESRERVTKEHVRPPTVNMATWSVFPLQPVSGDYSSDFILSMSVY